MRLRSNPYSGIHNLIAQFKVRSISPLPPEPDWRQIQTENHAISIRSVARLGEGWSSTAYLINKELVFKFPKSEECWQELEVEIKFLEWAASYLPLQVPRYRHVAPHSNASTFGYAVYHYLSGQALDLKVLPPTRRAEAADAIAGFLKTLHHLQPPSQIAQLLPREDQRSLAEDYLARAEREIFEKLPFRERSALSQQFELHLGRDANFSFEPVVIHADLGSDHLLNSNESVASVIDFGDVSWGDPDYDFMYLFADFGPEFVQEVARKYGHRDLELLYARLSILPLSIRSALS
jgi:aminoglycoside 2''-phosphotransferase